MLSEYDSLKNQFSIHLFLLSILSVSRYILASRFCASDKEYIKLNELFKMEVMHFITKNKSKNIVLLWIKSLNLI